MRRHSASESAYRMLLADKAYDSDALRKLVRLLGRSIRAFFDAETRQRSCLQWQPLQAVEVKCRCST
jgi:hypothetical protein